HHWRRRALAPFPTRRSSDLADTLGGVEVDERLVGVGVAQNPNAEAVHDEVSAAEVAEGNRERVGTDRGHVVVVVDRLAQDGGHTDRKSTRLNSSHVKISYAV